MSHTIETRDNLVALALRGLIGLSPQIRTYRSPEDGELVTEVRGVSEIHVRSAIRCRFGDGWIVEPNEAGDAVLVY